MLHNVHHVVAHRSRNPLRVALLAELRESPPVYPMISEVAVLIDQTFQIFLRDLDIKEFTISLTRCVGDGVDPSTDTGTDILFGNPLPILGLRTPHDNLVVVCVVVVCVAGVTVSSPLKSRNIVIVVVAVVLVVAAVVTGRIGPGGQWREG